MAKKEITSEKTLERKIPELVKQKGGICIKLLSDYITGLPDRMCLFPKGKLIFVELKTTGQKPRQSQIYIHRRLQALGFRVEVIDTLEGLIALIKSV